MPRPRSSICWRGLAVSITDVERCDFRMTSTSGGHHGQ
ncbi:hypothetical protein SynMEDNS5_01895 [Synechococcus sp. MEDNS5]|nr:hypothetical protein SynMEDNS5_01895 [Synechococcus sp. MEDNS5]